MTVAIEKGIMPLGEWKPDLGYLSNEGLVIADCLIPVYGNYITSPAVTEISGTIHGASAVARGLHVHQETGIGYGGFDVGGGAARIYSLDEAGTATDRSKVGAYLDGGFWYGCSYGQNVIMTNQRKDPVQYLSSGAAAFGDLITSTFAPKAELCFPFRQNLFVANCTTGAFDGLSAGHHPMLVAWSRNENPRQFGSFNATPEIVGAGYQDLLFDIGEIKSVAAASEYAVIGLSNGFVRVEGPPYVFRVFCRNTGTIWPYGICVADEDVYTWSQSGLIRFRGGDGPPEILGAGRWTRFLVDNVTGYSRHPVDSAAGEVDISMAHDPVNNLLFIAYLEHDIAGSNGKPKSLICYNISEDRATWFKLGIEGVSRNALFLRSGRHSQTSWCPGRDIRFIDCNPTLTSYRYSKWALGSSGFESQLQRGYIQFKTGFATRLVRIRPILSTTDDDPPPVSAVIESSNVPYGPRTVYGPYSSTDSHGWISTPTTYFHDFHAPMFVVAAGADSYKIASYRAFEYEIEIGPAYAA